MIGFGQTKQSELGKRVIAMKSSLFLGLLSVFLSPSLSALTLTSFDSSSLPGDAVELRLNFDGTPPSPSGYTTDSPARIALDLDGVKNGLEEKYHTLGNGNIRSLTIIGAGDKTRLIINLTSLVGYSSDVKNNQLVLTIGDSGVASVAEHSKTESTSESAEADAPVDTVKPAKTASSVAAHDIQEIDFRRGEQGEGQVIVKLSDRNLPIDLSESGGKIIVEFVGAGMPENLRRRLDVIDFATPVKLIDASGSEDTAKIAITPMGDYEYLAYQTDDTFTVSVKPMTAAELDRKRKEQFNYTGDKLSLNFQDIEVRSVLQLIADFTELNLVASDTVRGRITLRLQNVPWDQALDLILKTKGLDKRKVGNVMLVAPADEIAAREKLELESLKQVQELAPLRTEYLTVNYAKAADVAKLITESGFLTERGSVTVDERTNVLLLQDTASNIDEVRFMLEQLDVPVRQVVIEARIVIARSDAMEELGVRWGVGLTNIDNNGITLLHGNGVGLETNAANIANGDEFEIGSSTLALDLGVNNSDASRISLGFLDFDHGIVDLELSALESDGRADIVSTPKVLTADQQTAKIQSGTEIPYQEASSSGATSVSFKEAVLALEVTPQITPDGRIIMDLKVNQDSVGEVFADIPSIDTNSIETSIIVDNGQTVVLGGVFRSEEVESVSKTPFLGDLPVIGRLFRHTTKSSTKAELLVFITPRIMNDILARQ